MGYLYANPELVPDLPAPWSGYHAMEWSEQALVPALQPDARRLATGFPAPHQVEWSHASLDVLEEAGIRRRCTPRPSRRRAVRRPPSRDRGVAVADRDATTLVSFEVPDPEGFSQQAAEQDIVIRFLPEPAVGARVGRRVEHRRGARPAGGAGRGRRQRGLVAGQDQDAEHDRADHDRHSDDADDRVADRAAAVPFAPALERAR